MNLEQFRRFIFLGLACRYESAWVRKINAACPNPHKD